jgi:predicted O-methyltransferase YrrM
MYSSFQLAKNYIRYYLSARNGKGHGVHSPFVFDFIRQVLNDNGSYPPPAALEQLRNTLGKDSEWIDVEDFGAGSRRNRSSRKQISAIARTALKPKKYAEVLYRLARHYQPQTIVELGTSLGLTTAYLSMASPRSNIITVEGSEAIARRAMSNFRTLGISNIDVRIGPFDAILPSLLPAVRGIDLAYIDGNHRYGPTVHYFQQFLSKGGSHSIFVFDDIHWSAEMEKAWEEIKTHPSVRYTIDIFFLGFVFFREEFKERQDFIIRF